MEGFVRAIARKCGQHALAKILASAMPRKYILPAIPPNQRHSLWQWYRAGMLWIASFHILETYSALRLVSQNTGHEISRARIRASGLF